MQIFENASFISCEDKNQVFRALVEDNGKILYLGDSIPEIYSHAACNHPNADQRVSPLDALKMATHWAAKLSFDEDDRGTLAVGKRADFVVLNQHLLDIPVEKSKDTTVRALYVSGQLYAGQKDSAIHLLMKSVKNRPLSRA